MARRAPTCAGPARRSTTTAAAIAAAATHPVFTPCAAGRAQAVAAAATAPRHGQCRGQRAAAIADGRQAATLSSACPSLPDHHGQGSRGHRRGRESCVHKSPRAAWGTRTSTLCGASATSGGCQRGRKLQTSGRHRNLVDPGRGEGLGRCRAVLNRQPSHRNAKAVGAGSMGQRKRGP